MCRRVELVLLCWVRVLMIVLVLLEGGRVVIVTEVDVVGMTTVVEIEMLVEVDEVVGMTLCCVSLQFGGGGTKRPTW